jgi:molybdopterin-guanine dinucleotide biosynthesis protein A
MPAPLLAGILIGGKSQRMGRPKHLVEHAGRSFLEHVVAAASRVASEVVLLGNGERPAGLRHLVQLPDPVGLEGPLAGLVAAFTHRPEAGWLLLACDMPLLGEAALSWLVAQRGEAISALLPRTPDGWQQPVCAVYEPTLRGAVERLAKLHDGPSGLVGLPGVLLPEVPAALADAFRSFDSPNQLGTLGCPL